MDTTATAKKLRAYEREIIKLRQKLEEGVKDSAHRVREMEKLKAQYLGSEKQNSNLINFTVAVERLHSTFSYVEVVNVVKEIIVNLIGAEEFGIYVIDKQNHQLTMITHRGFKGTSMKIDDPVSRLVCKTSQPWIAGRGETRDDNGAMACVPLQMENEVLGLIVLYKLFVQKERFDERDFDLFELMGNHASAAIYSAKLFWIFEAELEMNIRREAFDFMPPSKATISRRYFRPIKKRTNIPD